MNMKQVKTNEVQLHVIMVPYLCLSIIASRDQEHDESQSGESYYISLWPYTQPFRDRKILVS